MGASREPLMAVLSMKVISTFNHCLAPSSSAVSWCREGSPGRAPKTVHLQAATTAPSCSICAGGMCVVMPYSTDPMKASPAPVVSATAPAGSPAAEATTICASRGGAAAVAAEMEDACTKAINKAATAAAAARGQANRLMFECSFDSKCSLQQQHAARNVRGDSVTNCLCLLQHRLQGQAE